LQSRTIRLLVSFFLVTAAGLPASALADERAQLNRIVFVGDSITAGFQNFSLFDSASVPGMPPGGQSHGLAAMIARQAGASITLPLISYPGIPPALAFSGGTIVREAGIGARENPAQQTTVLAVPGFTLADMLAHPFPGSPMENPIDALADSILGTPAGGIRGCGPIPLPFENPHEVVSEVVCAAALHPSTIVIDAGNNDALQTLTFGTPPTNAAVFGAEFDAIMATLVLGHRAAVVIGNIPDVTAIPFLIPAAAFEAQCGVSPGADFVVPDITNPSLTTFNICTTYATRSAAQIAAAHNAVLAYNATIAAEAKRFGASVVDVYGILNNLTKNGYTAANYHLTTAPFPCGGLFSLDAVHPTNTGYAILANAFIAVLSQKYKANIPLVDVNATAQADPLFPPNVLGPAVSTTCPGQ